MFYNFEIQKMSFKKINIQFKLYFLNNILLVKNRSALQILRHSNRLANQNLATNYPQLDGLLVHGQVLL